MRWLTVLVGTLATIGFVAVSGWMNFRFGMSLGRDALDGQVFGVASACADGMKAILPFVIVSAWRNVRLIMLMTSIVLWTLCATYSLTSSLGFAAGNRADVTDAKRLEASRLHELKSALKRKQSQFKRIGRQRDPATISNEIESHKQHRRWESTQGCERATVSLSRRFCERYFELRAEHAAALKAHRLDVDIDTLRRQLDGWKSSAGKSVDPQVSIIDQIVGLGEDRVTLVITILLSLMLEVGSGLGFFLVLDRSKADARKADQTVASAVELLPADGATVSDVHWLRERLRSDRLASVALWEAHQDYLRWCEAQRCRDTRTLTEFGMWLNQEVGLLLQDRSGQTRIDGVVLVGSDH